MLFSRARSIFLNVSFQTFLGRNFELYSQTTFLSCYLEHAGNPTDHFKNLESQKTRLMFFNCVKIVDFCGLCCKMLGRVKLDAFFVLTPCYTELFLKRNTVSNFKFAKSFVHNIFCAAVRSIYFRSIMKDT